MFNIRHGNRQPLSPLEADVLSAVWNHGEATAEQVRTAMSAHKPLKESTVRTLLRRIEEKGYLRHRTEGRTYVYSGCEEPNRLAASAVGQIIDRFCGGSLEQLLTGMVDAEVVDRAELRRLARKLGAEKKGR